MGLGAQRTKAHARGDKAFADCGNAFDLFEWHSLSKGFEIHQVAQVDRWVCPHALGILFPQLIAGAVTGRLHHVHGLRLPGVGFPSAA